MDGLEKKNPLKKGKVEIVLKVSDEIRDKSIDLIDREMIDLKGAKVVYIMAYPYINKKIGGKTVKATKELKFFANEADYVIEISNDLWSVLNDEMKEVLLLNQLLKINPVTNEKTGTIAYKITDHDFKGFHKIFKKYSGMDWFYRLREINSSLYDLSPSEAENFKV